MNTVKIYEVLHDPDTLKGDIGGLYGRAPIALQRIVRRVQDAHNYDYAAMELLDALGVEWRA